MTIYYETKTWSNESPPTEDQILWWQHLANKKNWRIVELLNGFFQTEYKSFDGASWNDVTRRKTIGDAEIAIDQSVEYYSRKIEFTNGPKVVKTFQ